MLTFSITTNIISFFYVVSCAVSFLSFLFSLLSFFSSSFLYFFLSPLFFSAQLTNM